MTEEVARWGAYPAEWEAFKALGLLDDLLPIVSNPAYPISPFSTLDRKGKTPSVLNAEGMIRGFPDWTKHHTTEAEAVVWAATPDYGLFISSRTVHGFDVDCDDPAIAERVMGVFAGLGLPIRYRGDSPRFLAMFRPSVPFKSRPALRLAEADNVVEFYGIGKGFVGAGAHPKGGRYDWVGGLPTSVPVLDPDKVEQLWAAIQSLQPPGLSKVSLSGDMTVEAALAAITVGDNIHDCLRYLAMKGWSVEALESLMMRSGARLTRPKEWQARWDDIPRLVTSGASIRSKEARRLFGDFPAPLPPGATAPPTDLPLWTGLPAPDWDAEKAFLEKREAAEEKASKGDRRDLEEFEDGPDDEIDLSPVIMTLEDMVNDLVFIESTGAAVHLPTMRARKAERLSKVFAASKIVWVDSNAGLQREVEALPKWIESPKRKSVDVLTWRPGASLICRPPELSEAGDRAVNLWRGFSAWPEPDDGVDRLGVWHEHLAYLVPDPEERRRFEQWVAHIAQNPGDLPHTCYLMYTETTGIGRNWLSKVLGRVFRGYVASGVSLGKVLDGGFNGRLAGKLLATVDEAREGTAGSHFKKREALKDLITMEYREINPKYGVPSVEYNCCRWLMLSNHRDAIPFDNKDRRVIVIANPTKRRDADYYNRVYAAIRDPKFIGALWHYLLRLDLSDFNHAAPAPMNDAKRAALGSMASEMEQAVATFLKEYPGDIVDRDTLLNFVTDMLDGATVNPYHFKRTLEEAGLIATDKRVRINGVRTRLVILRNLTKEQVERLTPTEAAAIINKARAESLLGDV